MQNHNIPSLATINYPTSPRRNSLQPSSHQYPGNIQRLFRLQNCLSFISSVSWNISKTFSPANLSWPHIINNPEIFKDFQASRSNHPANSIPAATSNDPATSSSNQQLQPAAAITSSNQQQQPAAAVNSSNHYQQLTAAINSSNQQQQPAAAINSSNQQPQTATTTRFRPTSSTYRIITGIC